MPMLKRGYGAVRNLRCKSGARFPPVPEKGSSPPTRDAIRSRIKTQTAVANSATSLFP